jgi:2'-5' RNA ligase
MSAIRTFISFDTPEPIRAKIITVQNELQKTEADIRWESIDKFHVTIKFLGDVEDALLPHVIEDIKTTLNDFTPFNVTYVGIGAFPNNRNPRIIWAGCKNVDGTLLTLKQSLDGCLVLRGFPIDHRTFQPHITLGRAKTNRGSHEIQEALQRIQLKPQHATIQEIHVMKSELKPQGSVYTLLRKIDLETR